MKFNPLRARFHEATISLVMARKTRSVIVLENLEKLWFNASKNLLA